MRALISVYDKSGIGELAQGLADLGWDLVSSGGTAQQLREAGLTVVDTAEITGFPAILGHRVVTLHPKIHGGILADRSNPHHVAEMEQYDIEGIDLVVGNLYPFGSDPAAFAHGGGTAEDVIDIGGPAMVRAAAKNHAHVGVVVDPADYDGVLAELRADGSLSAATRRRLARSAFAHTAAYDAAVVAWFDAGDEELLPPTLHVAATREERTLRYGENPHQKAALYRSQGEDPWWATATQHGGVALSYLNLYDADAAWILAHDLGSAGGSKPARPTVAIIKHANPCGVAVADTLAEAYQRAFDCDPRSAFGGIVALNQVVDDDTVVEMVAAAQADVVIAPGYAPGVVEALQAKRKNTRLLEAVAPTPPSRHLRPVSGGWLVQEPHRVVSSPDQWDVVTSRVPTADELADADLAFRVCAATISNSIVLVKDGVAWGIGAGQQNRVEAGQIAAEKAAGRAAGGACASDAFYPFPDGIEAAASAGVAVIVQPGGSVRDAENIAKADELGVAMVFTGERQFKH
ncbi:bifunctional phosphoribosylaminoimidazolecarboxamide formyltransferase/IMP cyclohydrolase [Aquihabitans sp. G128]|uniref:bifunctional phosphoribosylaminoimidazolecarboxamide formyltransferase/IMP cyclohydrolase n=1 Tax=Aquihabitans sp. G128 TaxID=2849779 RepID=UPI001C233792|nr:bifunctional phosphoribosylaminoimidazolecarboxamide formyltransferase/IMP cyclohydrolase [Aquihabitans sp. G128]QXC60379.1 bifunctional phosphoribosylaminoimidazolecarboxamide formyltransferase/IMP cyclohydrolase [Aquihabitans sp. G128]